MNLDQLASFVELARIQHFTRAAAQLHLAQPSLSRQIANLEAELGNELFHRTRGNVSLTPAGERLLPIAKRMLADAETARMEMADLRGLKVGKVRLGATPTLCTSLVVEILTDFRERFPGIEIEILERGSRILIEELAAGSLDLALIVTSVSSGPAQVVLEREPLLDERLVAVSASSGQPLFAPGRALALADLAQVPQLVFPQSYDVRAAVDKAFHKENLAIKAAVSGAEMDATLRFAERGLGLAIVPAMVALDRPGLQMHLLADESLVRTISIARRSDMALTHAAEALQAAVRQVADRLAQPSSELAGLVTRA